MTYNVSDIQTVLTPIFNDYGISRAVLFGSIAKGSKIDREIHATGVTIYEK